MKTFTRLSNAITATPTRPGSTEKPSERQQGDSKRNKSGDNNYYKMFYTKEKEEEQEQAGQTIERRPDNADDGGGNETGYGTVSRTDRDGNGKKSDNTLPEVRVSTTYQQEHRGRTRAEMSKIYGDDGGDKETSDGTVSRADRDGNRSKSEITLSDVLGTTIDQQGQRGRTSAESKIQLG